MKSSRFFTIILLIAGLFFMLSSNSMADTRFSIDKQSIKNIVEQSLNGNGSGFKPSGYTEIASKVKLQNSSDKRLTFDVTVTFVNAEKDKLGEATKTCKIKPGESKTVSSLVLLEPYEASKIDSGYVTITSAGNTVDAETHSLIATVNKDIKNEIANVSDKYVKIDYNVKLRNRSSKPVSSDLTIAFLDEDNVKIGEARTKGSFEAGESKTITDTIVLRTSDASRISSSRVTIQK